MQQWLLIFSFFKMICRVCLVILLSLSCDSYKLIDDWRWSDPIPNIYQLNQRQYNSEKSRSRQSNSYGRADLSSQSDWSWRDVREEDDRDVVVHMKRNHQKNSRLSDRWVPTTSSWPLFTLDLSLYLDHRTAATGSPTFHLTGDYPVSKYVAVFYN